MHPAYEGSVAYTIHAARGKRIALAGTVRSALLQLEKTPLLTAANFKAQFEGEALQRALVALLEPPPADRLTGAELAAAKSVLSRRLRDAGLGQIKTMLEAKGKERGRVVIAVDPRHTSQMRSACGYIDSESRPDQATFCCTACGFELNAVHNAAKNILTRALKSCP